MKAIYKIENLKSKDCYIGSTKDFTYRKWCHLRDLRAGKHHSPILQNSWNKHGEKSFTFDIIEEVEDVNLLIPREQYFLDTLKPRYNICKLAGSPLGVKHSYQARLNMSIAHKKLSKKERGHTDNCTCFICSPVSGKNHPQYIKREERSCTCGCGGVFMCMINSKKRFINGHNKSQKGRVRTKEHIEKQRLSLIKTLQSKCKQKS